MGQVYFNPPPNWPVPKSWNPPQGWQPDPAWGEAPQGWALWIDEHGQPVTPGVPATSVAPRSTPAPIPAPFPGAPTGFAATPYVAPPPPSPVGPGAYAGSVGAPPPPPPPPAIPYQPTPYSAAPYSGSPYGYAPARKQDFNGFAIASLVLGILWVFYIGTVLSVVFGCIALSQIKREGGRGRIMAIIGLTFSALWAIPFVIGFAHGFSQGLHGR